MQRKAYVTGTAALLAALLAGCTSGTSGGSPTDNANPGNAGTASPVAQPGKYRTLPEPCRAIGHDTLDSMLPGIKQIADPGQRDKAYQGQAALTYDTDRKVGCHWKVESTDATDRLSVDFERVVSYDNTVSDDDQAKKLFEGKESAADLPAPSSSSTTGGTTGTSRTSGTSTPTPTSSPSPSGSASSSANAGASASGSSSASSSDSAAADLQPRVLTDLGDEAYIDDQLGSSGSTAEQRTVTVVFRTSNVVVTIEYEEQPTTVGTAPDSKEMQDRARKLAAQLDDTLGG